MMHGPAISLSHELHAVGEALKGVRVLVNLLATDQCPNAEVAAQVPRSASVVLGLVVARLALLCAVVQGRLDAEVIAADWNLAEPNAEGPDVYLQPGRTPPRTRRGT